MTQDLGSGQIFNVFSVVFRLFAGKKIWQKKHRKFSRTQNFDATHSAIV